MESKPVVVGVIKGCDGVYRQLVGRFTKAMPIKRARWPCKAVEPAETAVVLVEFQNE